MSDALRQAIVGDDPEMPEAIRPLSWLWSMIDDCRTRGPGEECDDPSAYWEMVQEVDQMYGRIKAALSATDREKSP